MYCFLRSRPLIDHRDGDIRDLAALTRIMRETRPEIVFHLAAQSLVRQGYADPQGTFATNLLGSVNLLEAVRTTDSVRALVYVTSDKCYRNDGTRTAFREDDALGGADPYSASKACAELAFQAYRESFFAARGGLGVASARAGNVIGGGDRAADRIVPDTITALETGNPVRLRNPAHIRAWLHVLDPLYGYLALAAALLREPARFSGAWNFGPAATGMRSVEELARALVARWGSGTIAHDVAQEGPHEAAALYLSSEKARCELGWQALWPFERAAAETASWYRAVRDGSPPLEVTRQQIARFTSELN